MSNRYTSRIKKNMPILLLLGVLTPIVLLGFVNCSETRFETNGFSEKQSNSGALSGGTFESASTSGEVAIASSSSGDPKVAAPVNSTPKKDKKTTPKSQAPSPTNPTKNPIAAPGANPPPISISGCASQLQTIGWNGSQDIKVSTSAVDYENHLVGVNEKIDRHAGFSVSFKSSVYTQSVNFKSNVEMPSGFGIRITDTATGMEIPIDDKNMMGSVQYPSTEHPVMTIYTYKTPTQQGSRISVSFRKSFFMSQQMAFKTLMFELLCDNNVVAAGNNNFLNDYYSQNMPDTYIRDNTGASTLTNRDGDVYKHILVDRSVDGGTLLMRCPTTAKVGQTITCNLVNDRTPTIRWSIKNSYVQAHDDKTSVSLSNLSEGLHTVQAEGTTTKGYAVKSNIVFINVK